MLKYLLNLLFLFIVYINTWGQTYTTVRVSVDDAANPLIGGATNKVVLGFSVSKTAGAGSDLTNLVISTGLTDPNTVFSSVQLRKSATNFASAVSTGATPTLNAGNITFAGAPIHSFSGSAETQFFYVVATVSSSVATTVAAVPSITLGPLTEANTTYSGGAPTESPFSFSGSTFNFQALTTTVTQQAFAASYVGGSPDKAIYGFRASTNTNGPQDISQVVFTLNIDPTVVSNLSSFKLVNNGASSTYSGGGTAIGTVVPVGNPSNTITVNLSGGEAPLTTSDTYFFLVANVNTTMASTALTTTLTSVTTNPSGAGGITGGGVGTIQNTTVTALTATVIKESISASYTSGNVDKAFFGFKINTNGTTQDLNQVVFTLNIDPNAATSLNTFKLVDNGASAIYAGGGTTIVAPVLNTTPNTVTFSSLGVQINNSDKYFFLVANVNSAMASTTVTSTLTSVVVNNPTGAGGATGSGIGSNQNATITEPALSFTPIAPGTGVVPLSAVLSAGASTQVLAGFAVSSTGTQTITQFNFNYTPSTSVTTEYIYKNTTPGTLVGATIVDTDGSPDGTFNNAASLAEVVTSSTVYYYLIVDVAASVTSSTTAITPNLSQTSITKDIGTVNAFSFNRSYTFNTSQNSTIVLNGGTTNNIGYVNKRTGNPLTDSNSSSLATFRIRDGGGAVDGDDKPTVLTELIISIPANHTMLRRIAIFDGSSLVGTQQDVTGSTITFSGLSLSTSNDGSSETKDFTIRATFQNTVTDNARIDVTITGATASSTGSGFASFSASTSGEAAPANQLEVTASALSLSGNPSSTTIATNFPLILRAIDSQNNVDLDYGGAVALTRSGGAGTLSVQVGESLTPTFTNGVYNWTTLRLSQSGSYTLTVSDNAGNDEFSDPTTNITITSSSSTITPGTTTPATICYGNTVTGSVPTAYFPLSNIVITETDPAGISGSAGSYTFSISLPSGFVFDQSVTAGVATSGGADITIPAAPHYSYPASNTVQFSFNLTGTANTNSITIAGLKVGYTHPGTASPSPTGSLSITRAGGNANIAGVSPGAVLGTVGASQQNPAVTFTVDKALVTDPSVNADATTFNSNGAAVKLVSSSPTGSVFTGTNTSFVNPDYRFNPNGLSPGIYPITLTQTAANGCQSFSSKNFEVIISGIVNLDPSYCTNALPSSGPMSVSDAYVDQIMGVDGWAYDHFVYFDWNVGNWLPLVNDPVRFDPSIIAYQNSYQTFKSYGYPGLAVGFAVCNPGLGYICNGVSNYIATYQWVDLKVAPSVSFSLPGNVYTFCEDNVPVVLTGLPTNSNNTTDDRFDASGGQGASISNSLVPPVTGNQVWVFSPAAVTGVTPGSPQTFNITYKYKDPATGCSNTATRSITVKDRPTSVANTDITIPNNATEIKLCQNTPVGSFTASAGPQYKWYSDVGLTTQVGTGNTFTPPVDNTTPAITPFWVTRTTGATTIPFFAGCESDKGSVVTPLALSVNVVARPVAPTPNFPDAIRQYCVGSSFNATTDTHLIVPGTNIKWYNELGTNVFSGSSPTSTNLGLSTAAATVYKFSVTQTEAVNNCEGDISPVNVTIKALPIVSIITTSDVNKICTTGGNITFAAFDLADAGNPALNGTWSAAGIAGGALNQFPTLGTVNLDPSAVAPNNYSLQYQFTNNANCSNTGTLPIRVLPIAVPAVSIGNVCDQAAAVIINNSTVSPSPSSTTIDFVEWTFGDGSVLPPGASAATIDPTIHTGLTNGTYFSPTHIYPNVGTYQLAGALITSDGCRYVIPNTPVNVSPVPKISFSWQDACKDGISATRFLAVETTTPTQIPISSYAWNFNVNNTLTYSSAGTGFNPIVNYNKDGTDEVELLVTTAAGCTDMIKKPVYIVPSYPAITTTNAYTQSFDSGADGWIAGGTNSSWQLGTPDKTVIKGAASGANSWVTNLTGNNNPDESSWVLSRCYDFSQATKPVFSIDIWSNTPRGVDGAVLQYNETDNIENDANWIVIGTVGSGVNWYDDLGISNSPGNQTSGDLGWTGDASSSGGKYSTWQRAIFKLDNLISKPKVKFRIAFASKQASKDGFAFDNIFIGERTRNVLLENFTNSSGSVQSHNDGYKNSGNASEIVKVQYHTPFPGPDPINDLNPQMHNARSAFYGITESPTGRLDGLFKSGNISSWLPGLYDDRVLTPSPLKITITPTKIGEVVEIVTTVQNTSGQTADIGGTHLFTTIVEKSITSASLLGSSGNTEFVFVAKQMLPSPSGIMIPNDLAAGQTYTAPKIIWDLKNGDAIVVSVQSIVGNNKEVHQAQIALNPPQPDIVTGIEDWITSEEVEIYPNPANESFVIELPGKAENRLPVSIIDQIGRPVQEVSFEKGEQSKTIRTQDLAGGIYIVQIGTGKSGVIRKKVMVVHKN